MSRFNPTQVKVATVGAKVSTDLHPELTVNRQANSFAINGKGTDLMGIKAGSRVKFFEMESDDFNSKWFIAASPLVKDAEGNEVEDVTSAKVAQTGKHASVGRPASFSFAGVWGKMIQAKADAESLSMSALVEAGIAQNYQTMITEKGESLSSDLASQKVVLHIEKLEDATNVEIDGVVYAQVFALTNSKVESLEAPTVITRTKAPVKGAKVEAPVSEGSEEPKGKRTGRIL